MFQEQVRTVKEDGNDPFRKKAFLLMVQLLLE